MELQQQTVKRILSSIITCLLTPERVNVWEGMRFILSVAKGLGLGSKVCPLLLHNNDNELFMTLTKLFYLNEPPIDQ